MYMNNRRNEAKSYFYAQNILVVTNNNVFEFDVAIN